MSLRGLGKNAGAKAGIGAAALLMLGLIFLVGRLIIIWCPRGENCEEVGQLLYGFGLVVSLAVSVAAGFLVRDIVDRRAARRTDRF